MKFDFETNILHADLIETFNLNAASFALVKNKQKSKNYVNSRLRFEPLANGSVPRLKIPKRIIKNREQFYSSSLVPSDVRSYFVLGLDDFDNHSNVSFGSWLAEARKFAELTGMAASLTVPSTNKLGLHRYFRLFVDDAQWFYASGDGYAKMSREEQCNFIRHLFAVRHLALQTLRNEQVRLGQIDAMLKIDCMGKPAVFVKAGRHQQINIMGDLVRVAPELYLLTKSEWEEQIITYTVPEFILEIQKIINLIQNTKQLQTLINSYSLTPFEITKNNFTKLSPAKLTKEPVAKIADGAGSDIFGFPEKLNIEIGKYYNHCFMAQRLAFEAFDVRNQVVNYVRKSGEVVSKEYVRAKKINEERFRIIALAFVTGCLLARKSVGNYKNTVGRELVRKIINNWHASGHVSFKTASWDEIAVVETIMVQWGLLRVLDKHYVYGDKGICCKYDVNLAEDKVVSPIVGVKDFRGSLVRSFLTMFYVRKIGFLNMNKSEDSVLQEIWSEL